jgi:hypothetical protein
MNDAPWMIDRWHASVRCSAPLAQRAHCSATPPAAVAAAQLSAPHWQLAICGPPLPPNTGTGAAHTHDAGG